MGGAIGRKWKKPPRRLGGAVRKKKKEAAEKRMRKVMGRSGEANKRVGVRRKKKENWYKKMEEGRPKDMREEETRCGAGILPLT